MGTVRYKLDLNNPPSLSAETLAQLDAMTPEEIEENARNDSDNPPLTDDELDQMRLRDWEQGRWQPDAMALAYLTTIAHEPEAVARALEKQRATARGQRQTSTSASSAASAPAPGSRHM